MSLMRINPDAFNSPDEYLDDIKNRVTRYFCIFCFVLAILAIPASCFSNDRTTLIINLIGVFFYAIPLLIVLRSERYRLAARVFVCVAISATLINAFAANLDLSLSTVVWYFVYLVFAHLVLNLTWAIVVAGAGFLSVTTFAVLHLLGLNRMNQDLTEDSLIVGSPIALLVSFVALLYLLTVYKRLRDVMIGKVVESNKEKSQLVGAMSHDMRNYLGVIAAVTSLMREDLTSCSADEFVRSAGSNLDLADQASSKALAMVEDIVAASRDTADRRIHLENEEMLGFISPIVERYKMLARAKGIQCIVGEHSDHAVVAINKDRFSRAIENLLSNAVKFSQAGGMVTISTKCADNSVVLTVADTGIGIPPELHDKIFEPFTKAGRAGTADEKSIGLGLSTVKKTVSLHGGTIWFESEVGKGSTFHIRLAAQ
jgi:signal transduction histidine kinase